MDREKSILNFRNAFAILDEEDQVKEAKRIYRIVTGTPIIVFEDYETEKVYRFLDVPNLIEFLWKEKQIRADRSFIYKVLRGQHPAAYGFKVYYDYEGEN